MKSSSLNVDNIVAVLANVLYLIERLEFNVDRAFTHTCRKYRCHAIRFTREDLFNLTHNFISMNIFLRSLGEVLGRKNLSYRMYAKLFLYIKLRELGIPIPSKLNKAIIRDFGKIELDSIVHELEVWQKLSYPQWFYNELIKAMGVDEAVKMLDAMNKRIIWLRINTLKIDIDKALKTLELENVEFEVDKRIPFVIRLLFSPRPPRELKIVKEGLAIIQDKASVLTVLAMNPEPYDIIYDFAAAPGIKTSLIMQLTENKAYVIAFDRSPRRISSMKSLLKKYGVNIERVQIVLTDSRVVNLSKQADIALVDAPCSSSGAIPKDPSIKLMLKNPGIPKKMHQIQVALLKNALKYSERVVYSTCSVLPIEGEEVIEKIINETDVKLEDLSISASKGYKQYNIWNRIRRTYPHIDECEGFFIAKIAS
ncbi:MAG: RsmB/NOP family class I SAM-dependent RNA methyltransferase [Ignisphaera sp.]|uniref:RsmB/NOP family class I SAM-dependent RNA methyltransferase n=1 Tax=Ignisphaera aggregans TaxID=334771 RepID=A0A7C4NLL1_9CREN